MVATLVAGNVGRTRYSLLTVATVTAAAEDDRKLFVGGLPQEVSEEELNEHFGQFGEIESVNLKTDPNTGRSRGFCFVVYKVGVLRGVPSGQKAVS